MWSAWIVALPPLRPRLILFFLRERPTLGLAARQDVRRQRQDPPEIRRPHRYRAAIQPPTPPPPLQAGRANLRACLGRDQSRLLQRGSRRPRQASRHRRQERGRRKPARGKQVLSKQARATRQAGRHRRRARGRRPLRANRRHHHRIRTSPRRRPLPQSRGCLRPRPRVRVHLPLATPWPARHQHIDNRLWCVVV